MDKVYVVVSTRLGIVVYIAQNKIRVDYWLRVQERLFKRDPGEFVVTHIGVGYQAVEFVGPPVADTTYLYAPQMHIMEE